MTDTRHWRLGNRHGIHGYAESLTSFDDEPIFTAMDPSIAQQIIEDHQGHEELHREIVNQTRKILDLQRQNKELRCRNAVLERNAVRALYVLGRNAPRPETDSTSTPVDEADCSA